MKYKFKNWDLQQHQTFVRAYVNSVVFSPQDKLMFYRKFDRLAILYGGTYLLELIEQIIAEPNPEKIKKVTLRIAYGTDVITLVGMTGSGKTAFMFFMAELIYKMNGRRSYFVGFPYIEGLPDFIYFLDKEDIKQPVNAVIWIDEVGLLFDTKTWSSKDNELLNDLMRLKRQRGNTYIFGSQVGSDMSLEMYRRGEIMLIRKFSFKMLETDNRKELFKPYQFFFPTNNRDMLFISQNYVTFLNTHLASCWDNRISNAFGSKMV